MALVVSIASGTTPIGLDVDNPMQYIPMEATPTDAPRSTALLCVPD
jgi:hypothetical protein